jgi:hypothetical protein
MYTLLCTYGIADQNTVFCGVFDTREAVDIYINSQIQKNNGQHGEYSLFYSKINEKVSMEPWSNYDILHVEKLTN